MTDKEAKRYILANWFDGDDDVRAVGEEGCDDDYKAMRHAVEALEYREPKKPNYGMAQGHRWRSCPTCCARVLNTYKFCDQCGQAIDWSEQK